MQQYSWPGNIRELQNVIERCVILAESEVLRLSSGMLMQEPPSIATPPIATGFESDRRAQIEACCGRRVARFMGHKALPLGSGYLQRHLIRNCARLGSTSINSRNGEHNHRRPREPRPRLHHDSPPPPPCSLRPQVLVIPPPTIRGNPDSRSNCCFILSFALEQRCHLLSDTTRTDRSNRMIPKLKVVVIAAGLFWGPLICVSYAQ